MAQASFSTQLGIRVHGAQNDECGASVAINRDGTVIAMGCTGNGVTYSSGYAQVYAWDDSSSSWVQRGSNLYGNNYGGDFGQSVALNAAGDVVAVGAPYHFESHDGGQSGDGIVRVFRWFDNSWQSMGTTEDNAAGAFVGEEEGRFGQSVALNGAGNILAFGAPNYDEDDAGYGDTQLRGRVVVQRYNGYEWTQFGQVLKATKYF